MKKLAYLGFSAILLFAATTSKINAQELENAADRVQQGEEYAEKRISPFSLVSAAYRGRFEDWDIPGYANLETEYEAGNLTAKDLVNVGIEAGELAPQAAEDEGYINNVDAELDGLVED